GAINDGLVEGPESYQVALTNPGSTTGAAVVGTGLVTTTIPDANKALFTFNLPGLDALEGKGLNAGKSLGTLWTGFSYTLVSEVEKNNTSTNAFVLTTDQSGTTSLSVGTNNVTSAGSPYTVTVNNGFTDIVIKIWVGTTNPDAITVTTPGDVNIAYGL